MKFKNTSFILALLGLVIAGSLVYKINQPAPPAVPLVQPPINPYLHTIAASGIVESLDENVEIGVPVPGLITEVDVEVWDRVKKGQPLFKLDDRDLQAQLLKLNANVVVAAASLVRLQDQWNRLRKLHDQDPRAVSVDDLNTRENDVKVAAAQLKAAKAEVEQTKALIDRLVVRAPKDGVILQNNIRPGQYAALTPNDPALVLGTIEPLQIRADVDEQNASLIRPHMKAVAYPKNNTTIAIPLHFLRIEPYVIPKKSLTGASDERVDTRVLQIIYSFEQPKEATIYVGQQVDVFIEAEPLKKL